MEKFYLTNKMHDAIKTLVPSKVAKLCSVLLNVKEASKEVDKVWGMLFQDKALLDSAQKVEKFVEIVECLFSFGVYAKNPYIAMNLSSECSASEVRNNFVKSSTLEYLEPDIAQALISFESSEYLCTDIEAKMAKSVERNGTMLMYNLIWNGYFEVAKILNERLGVSIMAPMVLASAHFSKTGHHLSRLVHPVYYAAIGHDVRYLDRLIESGVIKYEDLGQMKVNGESSFCAKDLLQVMSMESHYLEVFGNVLFSEHYDSGSVGKEEQASMLLYKDFMSNLILNSNISRNNKNSETFLSILSKKESTFGLLFVFKILEEKGLLFEALGVPCENKTVGYFIEKRLNLLKKKRFFDQKSPKCIELLLEKIKMYKEVNLLTSIVVKPTGAGVGGIKESSGETLKARERKGFAGLLEVEKDMKKSGSESKEEGGVVAPASRINRGL